LTAALAGYVDLSRSFDAEYAATVEVDLPSLLLVRSLSAADALEIIHALVASGGIGVLVVDSLSLLQSVPRDAVLLDQALRVLPGPLASSPCALIALTVLPYSPAMVRALAFQGSALAHTATVRLHVAREAWLRDAAPGCYARITVLKQKLAPPDGAACVMIRFEEVWRLR
jgi:recombination protein RecA